MKSKPIAEGKSLWVIDSPIGQIGLAEDGAGLSDLFFVRPGAGPDGASPLAEGATGAETSPSAGADVLKGASGLWATAHLEPLLQQTPLLREASAQISAYFAGERKTFDLPLSYRGTPFQTDDWEALLRIPYGETRSYKDIAVQIGRPRAYRAVGLANNRNPISIIIPCHRVIGQDGSLVGYGGGLTQKAFLLDLERRYSG